MLMTVRVTLHKGRPPKIRDIKFSKSRNGLHHLIVWELRGQGAAQACFRKLAWDPTPPDSPDPHTVFGPFTCVDQSPWAVMANKHLSKRTEGHWSYKLTLAVRRGGKIRLLRVPPITSGRNPNIKNN